MERVVPVRSKTDALKSRSPRALGSTKGASAINPEYVQTLISILVVGLFVCFCAPGCIAQGELSRPTNPGAGAHSFTLTVGGLERTYIVHVPSSYNVQKQLSAVVIMVGKSSDKIKATDVIWDFFEKHPMK